MPFVRLAPLSLVLLAGCVPMAAPDVPVTTSNLVSSSGAVIGTVRVFSEPTGVTLRIDAAGLPPGIHGVHVHTVARCDPPDFKSAGAHWNPASKQHGMNNPAGPHAGDLPNIEVAADGKGRLESTTELLSLMSGATAIFDADGSALVIHAAPDDFRTDPTGNSGARIACGVITKR